ncbi:MAG: hypothetical protein IIT70_04910, partial [Clostridia bacterium]|nr:hypothetical protein [Clostridia bacterium]
MAIEIIDFNTKDYICTLKRESGNNYILTDRSNRAVGYCKEESSFPYQVASLELYWNDGTKFGTVERQLGM